MTPSQTQTHGTKGDVKGHGSRLGLTRSPRKPTLAGRPRGPILQDPWHLDPKWRPRGAKMPGNLGEPSCIYRAFKQFVLEGHMVGCFVPALVRPDRGVNFGLF